MNDPQIAVVTGGAGFIGSHLVEGLLAEGLTVRVVDNLSSGKLANLSACSGRIEVVQADVANFAECEAAAVGASYVFHLAAIPSVPRSILDPLASHASGPTATLNMLEASRRAGVRRFILAASSSAYGDTEVLPKQEDMLPRPLSPYAAGKLAGEHYVRAYAQSMGLDGACLRYFNIFGPRQDPSSPYSGVISLFARLMREGVRPTILGDGTQSRDFTYVENAVRANILAMKSDHPLGGDVFNVGTSRRVTLLDLVAAINGVLETRLEPQFGPERAGDVKHSQASLNKIESALGYRVAVDFEDGLRRTLAGGA